MAHAALLLQLLWEQGNLPELKRHAGNWLSSPLPFLRARAHLGLAVVSLEDGAEATAVEHLAIATAFADPAELMESMPGALASFPQPSLIRAGDLTLELLREYVWTVIADDAPPDDSKLTGMTAIEALDRVARYLGLLDTVDERNLSFFYLVSERAWDSEDLDTAIVAREHLCAMLTKIGSARGSRAREIGWLATLYKQRGRISEAETLYQHAIELGTSVLDAAELSSIIGRYGNLLHEITDYDAAVHVQWNAIRTRKPHLDLPEFPSDAGSLQRALGPEGIPDTEAPEWALDLANLTNCFQAAGYLDLAKVTLGYAKRAEEAGLRMVKDPGSHPNPSHAQWMIK
jgi:tetratricopeptide (TPR) repeat protein